MSLHMFIIRIPFRVVPARENALGHLDAKFFLHHLDGLCSATLRVPDPTANRLVFDFGDHLHGNEYWPFGLHDLLDAVGEVFQVVEGES